MVIKEVLLLEFLNYRFMKRALLAGNLVGIVAPLVGVFLNLRRLSLIGHALSHVALAGVAIGLFCRVFSYLFSNYCLYNRCLSNRKITPGLCWLCRIITCNNFGCWFGDCNNFNQSFAKKCRYSELFVWQYFSGW